MQVPREPYRKKSPCVVESSSLARGVTLNGGNSSPWQATGGGRSGGRCVSGTSAGIGHPGKDDLRRIRVSGWKGIWKAMSPVFGLSLPDPWHSGRDSGMRSETLNGCGTVGPATRLPQASASLICEAGVRDASPAHRAAGVDCGEAPRRSEGAAWHRALRVHLY